MHTHDSSTQIQVHLYIPKGMRGMCDVTGYQGDQIWRHSDEIMVALYIRLKQTFSFFAFSSNNTNNFLIVHSIVFDVVKKLF